MVYCEWVEWIECREIVLISDGAGEAAFSRLGGWCRLYDDAAGAVG